ncbi:MAG: serine hydrolase domain-containing protein [Planctomycetota bacterium]
MSSCVVGAQGDSAASRSPFDVVDEQVSVLLAELDAPGATFALRHGQETRLGAAGFVDDEHQEPMPADARMRLGSVTKLYLAGVVLQLVDEGVLDLDHVISNYVDGVPNGDKITLRMLGRHTSGLDDAIRQMSFHERLAADPRKKWQTPALLKAAFDPGPRFEPGERWAYSNTNSILLGLAIEKATGRSWREHVRERFIEPLVLSNTGFDEPTTARGYRYGKNEDPVGYGGVDDHRWFDATDWSPSWAGAAGEMTGTAADTAVFIQALFGGDLLSKTTQAELADFRDTGDGQFFYGFHCHPVGRDFAIEAWGHGGDVPGFSSSAVWLPESETAVVILANLSAELDKWSSASKLMEVALVALADGRMGASLRQVIDETPIHEAAVVVIRDGQAGEPLGDATRRYRVGSVSKLLTALLVLRAQEAGVISLNDPVVKFLPGVLSGNGAEDVTLAHLMEHTGGLAGSSPAEYAANIPGLDPSDYVTQRKPFALRWRPGLHYSYSNPGYTIAAAVVEQAWGDDFDELMRREVFEPLGMVDTTFEGDSPPSFLADGQTSASPWYMPVRPAGSAITTAADLAKVVEMLLEDGGDFLTASSVERLERGETGLLAHAGGGSGSYGLGTFAYVADDHVLRAHWGKTEGFRATLAYDPSGASGYVLLVDTAADRDVHRLRTLFNHEINRYTPEPEIPPSIGPSPVDVAGLYVNYSHDGEQRAWLFALLQASRLTPAPEGLRVDPLWFGSSTTWNRIDERLYQMDGLPVVSGATASIDGTAFWSDGESYQRTPEWSYWLQLFIMFAGIAASVFALVLFSFAILFRVCLCLKKRKMNAVMNGLLPLACFSIAGAAFLGLLMGFVLYQLGDLAIIASIGRISFASLTILIASIAGPISTVAGLFVLWSNRRSRVSQLTGVVLGLPIASLSVLLIKYGMIPFISWTG